MINLLLLTFVFSFFLYTLQNFIYVNVKKLIPVERKIITILVFVLILALIILFFFRYIPIAVRQLSTIITQIGDFKFEHVKWKIDAKILDWIKGIDIKNIDPKSYITTGGNAAVKTLTNIGKFGFEIFMALILSFFFIIEKEEVANFGKSIEESKLGGVYRNIKYFVQSFVRSFAMVMQAQLIIAFVNSVISMITLSLLGFPDVIGLGFMIFLLGLIPVAGVWVSLVPLTIIAIKVGGFIKVLDVWIMIAVIHCIEAYVLNPKIMSMNTKLPVFMTFLILLISENLMGVWGLLFGIPIFLFILDIFDVRQKIKPKASKKLLDK
ncbi:AI-2E family transporter [Clostridium sp. 19966]|nr:AI-2E family transporter [Clostridium sp. 19966]